jgi:hypothetical protein
MRVMRPGLARPPPRVCQSVMRVGDDGGLSSGRGANAMPVGYPPTLIGFPGVLVAVAIGVTVP